MDFFGFLTLLGGLALFLYGMDMMGDGLKKLAGGKLESILASLTKNRITGFLLGLCVTAIIQSSSATTVMLVGFVNSGIMKLSQTISIIMGANVGTTVTAWILSLSGIDGGEVFLLKLLKPSSFTPVLAVIGVAVMMFSKKDRKRDMGMIMVGFAVLMFGMETMSSAVAGLKDDPSFTRLLIMFQNPFMGILIGTVLTAIIQSSSASVGILQALALSAPIPYATAIPIILGQNIGTTITPILSAITGNREAKRVAFACLFIKMLGVIIVTPIFYILNSFIGFSFMNENVSALNIAVVHTLFNIITTVILIPFTGVIEKAVKKIIRGKKAKIDVLDTLDERFIDVPGFAVEKCRELVDDMANIARDSYEKATGLLNDYNEDTILKVSDSEKEVDRYEDKISTYLVKLSGKNLSGKDSREVSELLHCIGDIERISDHAVNICEAITEIHDKKIEFSHDALHDISVISDATREVLTLAVTALCNEDLAVAKEVEPLEQVIDRLKRKIKNNHIKRLQDGGCTVELGFILSDLLTNYERIADHCSNIAVCLLETANGSFETHEYLNHVKAEGENEFYEQYDMYKKKYVL